MSAYHNPDWAECYDLWVRYLFGDGPAEDIPVIEALLKELLAGTRQPNFKIIDIGTGSGRVPIYLQRCIREHSLHLPPAGSVFQDPITFDIVGIEPASAMLDRAQRFWGEEVKKNDGSTLPRFSDRWIQCAASDFAQHILPSVGKVDLIIFAAGGITHVTTDSAITSFLQGVSQTLSETGKAIVSILHDTLPENLQDKVETVSSRAAKPTVIPSEDKPGEVYVKYPTSQTWSEHVRSEKFRLDVENEEGTVLRSHDLQWDMRMFDKEKWETMLVEAGLKVDRVVDGGIQFWYILAKA